MTKCCRYPERCPKTGFEWDLSYEQTATCTAHYITGGRLHLAGGAQLLVGAPVVGGLGLAAEHLLLARRAQVLHLLAQAPQHAVVLRAGAGHHTACQDHCPATIQYPFWKTQLPFTTVLTPVLRPSGSPLGCAAMQHEEASAAENAAVLRLKESSLHVRLHMNKRPVRGPHATCVREADRATARKPAMRAPPRTCRRTASRRPPCRRWPGGCPG